MEKRRRIIGLLSRTPSAGADRFAVLIEVRRGDVSGFGNGNQRQGEAAVRHGDGAFQEVEILGQGALVKNVQLIFAGRDVRRCGTGRSPASRRTTACRPRR